MPHLILLGDSIFDNASYVPDRPAVIEQVRTALPKEWKASLLAVDGHSTRDVAGQLARLPDDATYLFVSVGGNDALPAGMLLQQTVNSVEEALNLLEDIRAQFREEYRQILASVSAIGKPAAVCTIYDAVPGLSKAESAALAGFNEVILREAFAAKLPVIDLRLLCDQPSDFSHVSPIEPSATGGLKISRVIAEIAAIHDFSLGMSVIYR